MPPRLPPIRFPEKTLGRTYLLRPFSSFGRLNQDTDSVKGFLSTLQNEPSSVDVAPRFYDGRPRVDFDIFGPMSNILRAQREKSRATRQATIDSIAEHGRISDLERMMMRRWKPGDVYAPHDLSPIEMKKWRTKRPPLRDAFDVLAINPINEYKNFSIMSEYMTTMGRIKHSSETGLRPRNQRRIAKAIRRAIGIGIMPSSYHHPEILEHSAKSRASNARRV